MLYKVFLYVLILLLTMACNAVEKENQDLEITKPYVILKLDDLKGKQSHVHEGWIEVFDFLNEQNIIGTIGLIGESLEEDKPNYFDWIKKRNNEGHEIWNHGFCHCKQNIGEETEIREFRGKDYAAQCESIINTQKLAKDKLGITLRSFGAPYNSTDEHTAKALAKIPELDIWMFKETDVSSDKFILNRIKEVNIEYPTHIPDFKKFKLGYDKNKNEQIIIIQGHPRSWMEDKTRFEEFKKIVLFLKEEGVQFITPYEYYSLQKIKQE